MKFNEAIQQVNSNLSEASKDSSFQVYFGPNAGEANIPGAKIDEVKKAMQWDKVHEDLRKIVDKCVSAIEKYSMEITDIRDDISRMPTTNRKTSAGRITSVPLHDRTAVEGYASCLAKAYDEYFQYFLEVRGAAKTYNDTGVLPKARNYTSSIEEIASRL